MNVRVARALERQVELTRHGAVGLLDGRELEMLDRAGAHTTSRRHGDDSIFAPRELSIDVELCGGWVVASGCKYGDEGEREGALK
jgi:hypothetical protein